MRTSSDPRRGSALADPILFGLALLLLALPLPALLGRLDLDADRLALLGVIVAAPAVTLLWAHWRASRSAVRPAAPEPRPLVAPRDPEAERDEPTLDPAEISASRLGVAAPAPARRSVRRSSMAPGSRDAGERAG